MKEFADDNFEFDENDRKLSKRLENTVERGEIAHYKRFLLFPQCFQKSLLQTRKNKDLFGIGLTDRVISWWSMTHMCFLAFSHQYHHKFSFQSHRLLFSHASAEVRGEKYARKKVCLNRGSNSQPPGHESETLTTQPPWKGQTF